MQQQGGAESRAAGELVWLSSFVAALPVQRFSLAVRIRFKNRPRHLILVPCFHSTTSETSLWDVCMWEQKVQRYLFGFGLSAEIFLSSCYVERQSKCLSEPTEFQLFSSCCVFINSQILVEFQSFKLYECLWTRLSLSAFSPPQRRPAVFRVEVLKCF